MSAGGARQGRRPAPARRPVSALAAGVTLVALGVFSAVVLYGSWTLRGELRRQFVSREAAILYPVALLQLDRAEEELLLEGDLAFDDREVLAAVLQTAEMKGVRDVRLYGADGVFYSDFDDVVPADALPGDVMSRLRGLQPVGRFYPDALLSSFYLGLEPGAEERPGPVLEVLLPLHRSGDEEILGVAQYLIDGRPMAREFESLDRNLRLQAGLALLAGGGLLAAVLLWAFHRLERAQCLLEERGRRLLQANHELALAAKTSAVGSVAAHLIHGLRNPLAGLQEFVASSGPAPAASGDPGPGGVGAGAAGAEEDRRLAAESARRMRAMIQEIVDVLRGEEEGEVFDFTWEEIRAIVAGKAGPVAEAAGAVLEIGPAPSGSIDGRRGNLLCLILMNLINNAIEASPAGGRVTVSLREEPGGGGADGAEVAIEVADTGPGIDEAVRDHLFSPIRSTKEGGSGIGLAITHQLARHIGAEVSLVQTGPGGTRFSVRLAPVAFSPDNGSLLPVEPQTP